MQLLQVLLPVFYLLHGREQAAAQVIELLAALVDTVLHGAGQPLALELQTAQ